MGKVKVQNWLSWLTRKGTYKEGEFEEDAENIVAHYRNEGYIRATVGQPDIEYLELSEDGKSREISLRIPIDEGERYVLGNLGFAGNEVLIEEGLKLIFDNVKPGDFYSEGEVRQGFEDARELYGSLGYYEMTLVPELSARDDLATESATSGNGDGNDDLNSNAETDGNGNGNGNGELNSSAESSEVDAVSYTPLRAHETDS